MVLEMFTIDRFIVHPKGNWSLGYLFFLWRHEDAIFWDHTFSNISTIKGWFLFGSWLDDSSIQVINKTDKAHAIYYP